MYGLSTEADKDLEDIFAYTTDKFGLEQAITYISSFEELFELLANNPSWAGREKKSVTDCIVLSKKAM